MSVIRLCWPCTSRACTTVRASFSGSGLSFLPVPVSIYYKLLETLRRLDGAVVDTLAVRRYGVMWPWLCSHISDDFLNVYCSLSLSYHLVAGCRLFSDAAIPDMGCSDTSSSCNTRASWLILTKFSIPFRVVCKYSDPKLSTWYAPRLFVYSLE